MVRRIWRSMAVSPMVMGHWILNVAKGSLQTINPKSIIVAPLNVISDLKYLWLLELLQVPVRYPLGKLSCHPEVMGEAVQNFK